MVEGLGEEVCHRAAAARLDVGGTVHHPLDAAVDDGAAAHGAGFQRHEQLTLPQPPAAQLFAGRVNGQQLGVVEGVFLSLAGVVGGWRLWQCELFVTLEPCPMCSGGIINSRIRRVVYGAADTKAGCCGSVTDLFALPFNHHPVVERGLREEEAQALLQAFFLRLREQRAAKPRWKPPVTP